MFAVVVFFEYAQKYLKCLKDDTPRSQYVESCKCQKKAKTGVQMIPVMDAVHAFLFRPKIASNNIVLLNMMNLGKANVA